MPRSESDREQRVESLSRRTFLRTLPAAATIGATGTAAGQQVVSGNTTALANHNRAFFGYQAHKRAILYGSNGDPSVHVWYTEGSRGSVIEWVDADDRRRLIGEYQGDRTATVAAPANHLGIDGGLGSTDGLAQRDYVEAVDLNVRMDLVEPVSPETAENVPVIDHSQLGYFDRLRTDPIDKAGVAYDGDFAQTKMTVARDVTDADAAAFGGALPDTSDLLVAPIDTGTNVADGAIFGTGGTGTPRIHDASKDFVSDAEPTVGEQGFSAIEDGNGHGSWVSGCIAADPDPNTWPDVQAYLPAADLLVLRALDGDGSGSTADIARAVRYAADQGADLVCMSLGAPIWSEELDRALAYAIDKGTIPFAAVGNDRQVTTWVATPASSMNAIGVASVTVDPPADAKSAYYSNVGPHPSSTDFSGGATTGVQPDLAGPGCKLGALTADTTGSLSIEYLTGTSMATPCTVGGAGLVVADDGTLRGEYEDLRSRLTDTARPVPAAAPSEVGAGMIAAAAAAAGNEPDETQAEATDSEAVARDTAYEQYSNVQGRTVFQFLG